MTIEKLLEEMVKNFIQKSIEYPGWDINSLMKISEPTFRKIWDNPEDDIYDTL